MEDTHVKADACAVETGVSLELLMRNRVKSGVSVVIEQLEGMTDERKSWWKVVIFELLVLPW